MAIIVNPPTLNTVVPNARKKHKIFGIAVYCCIALIAASFISFAAVGIATVTTMGKISMFFAMIPFFGFVLGGALLSVFSTKRARLAGLVNLLDRVESSDYSVLVSLSPVAEAAYMTRTAETVKKCVAQGLLPDYEIVADVVVAKKSIAMSDADAKTAYDDYIALAMPNAAYVDMVRDESKPAFCPSCGARQATAAGNSVSIAEQNSVRNEKTTIFRETAYRMWYAVFIKPQYILFSFKNRIQIFDNDR